MNWGIRLVVFLGAWCGLSAPLRATEKGRVGGSGATLGRTTRLPCLDDAEAALSEAPGHGGRKKGTAQDDGPPPASDLTLLDRKIRRDMEDLSEDDLKELKLHQPIYAMGRLAREAAETGKVSPLLQEFADTMAAIMKSAELQPGNFNRYDADRIMETFHIDENGKIDVQGLREMLATGDHNQAQRTMKDAGTLLGRVDWLEVFEPPSKLGQQMRQVRDRLAVEGAKEYRKLTKAEVDQKVQAALNKIQAMNTPASRRVLQYLRDNPSIKLVAQASPNLRGATHDSVTDEVKIPITLLDSLKGTENDWARLILHEVWHSIDDHGKLPRADNWRTDDLAFITEMRANLASTDTGADFAQAYKWTFTNYQGETLKMIELAKENGIVNPTPQALYEFVWKRYMRETGNDETPDLL